MSNRRARLATLGAAVVACCALYPSSATVTTAPDPSHLPKDGAVSVQTFVQRLSLLAPDVDRPADPFNGFTQR